MPRLSTVAVSTLVPALKVLSTTFPVSTCLRVVRTKAPPLPGLTCWNAVTVQSWPSRFSTRPFFRSFVLATVGFLLCRTGVSDDHEFFRGQGEELRPALADHEGVLDADPAPPRQVDAGLDGDRHTGRKCPGTCLRQRRCLVDLQPDAVAEAVQELVPVPGLLDHLARRAVDVAHLHARLQGVAPGRLRPRDQVVQVALPVGGPRSEEHTSELQSLAYLVCRLL